MFLNKIKFNYNVKILDDLIAEKNYTKILSTLSNNLNNSDLFRELLNYIYSKYLSKPEHYQLYQNKFLWVSSFDSSDSRYVLGFLNFYMSKLSQYSFESGSYKNILEECINALGSNNFPAKIDFSETIKNSNYYQALMLLYKNKKYLILDTEASFFEAKDNKYFIYPQSTLAYLHIVRNPLNLYKKYKDKYSSQDALNFLGSYEENTDNGQIVIETKQNWSTNVNSWNDDNVKNAFRGKILRYEDLILNTEESLIEIIFHIKQSGVDIEMDYKLIESYIENNPISEKTFEDVSNQEVKKAMVNIDINLLNEFNYDIDN